MWACTGPPMCLRDGQLGVPGPPCVGSWRGRFSGEATSKSTLQTARTSNRSGWRHRLHGSLQRLTVLEPSARMRAPLSLTKRLRESGPACASFAWDSAPGSDRLYFDMAEMHKRGSGSVRATDLSCRPLHPSLLHHAPAPGTRSRSRRRLRVFPQGRTVDCPRPRLRCDWRNTAPIAYRQGEGPVL